MPSIARRATIKPIVICIKSFKRKWFKSKKQKEKARPKEM
jgi:hypothetical protein